MKRDQRPGWREGLADLGSLFLEPVPKAPRQASGPEPAAAEPLLADETAWLRRRAQASGAALSPRRDRLMKDRITPRDILDELLEGGRDPEAPQAEGLDRLTRRPAPDRSAAFQRPKAASAPPPSAAPSGETLSLLFLTPPARTGQAAPARDAAKKAAKASKKRSRKKKTTHYLSKETFDALTKAKEAIRKLAPRETRSGISKSHIVDSALKVLLQDFENKGERSRLVKKALAARDKS